MIVSTNLGVFIVKDGLELLHKVRERQQNLAQMGRKIDYPQIYFTYPETKENLLMFLPFTEIV